MQTANTSLASERPLARSGRPTVSPLRRLVLALFLAAGLPGLPAPLARARAQEAPTGGLGPATPEEEGAAAAPTAPGDATAPGDQPAPAAPGGEGGGAAPAAPGGAAPAANGGAGAQPGRAVTPILPKSDRFLGERVTIAPGEIEVLEFLRFLADYTGLPVVLDSTNPQVAQTKILIAAEMKDVTADIVIALLMTNRFLVTRETLPSGEEILKVESQQGAVQIDVEPTENKLIRVDGQTAELITKELDTSVRSIRPDEIATMVFTLKYTQPSDAIQSLNSLIGGPKGAAARSRAFSIVDVKNSMLVIITAKFGLLNYLAKLLTIIDVPIQEPERIIQLIDVENADAEELTQLIQTFLQGRGSSRLGGRGVGVGAPGQPGQPGVAGAAGRGNTQDYQTNLIADWRTQKIIVETYSERDLEDIHMLVRELDARFDIRRLKTRIYQVRYLKADEVAADLQLLVGGAGGGLSGRAGLGAGGRTTGRAGAASRSTRGSIPRVGSRAGATATPTPTAGVPGAAGGQNNPIPALIVPHIQTNSLIIQAEPEDYAEVLNVLNQIDVKRRQVFLEAALVEVTSSSALNYSIELLAGEPHDTATRGLFESSFGLSGIDLQEFNRVIPDLSDPAAVPPGGFFALLHRGKFPALVRFFKSNTDTQVLATPFILADDNQQNVIDILETRYVQNTNISTGGGVATTSNDSEDAGITLEITPTISSRSAVFLELLLEVSQFQANAGTAQVLPPKTTNTITSAVTIPDGEIFVIGGLTRENKAKSVSKVPILGDIPLLGKLFRSEATSTSLSNLYIFLRAHILTHPDFEDGKDLTRQAQNLVEAFAPGLKPTRFDAPDVGNVPPKPVDLDSQERIYRNAQGSRFREGYEAPRGVYEPRRGTTLPPEGYLEGRRELPALPGDSGSSGDTGASAQPPSTPEGDGGLSAPPAPADKVDEPAVLNQRALRGTGLQPDSEAKSWLVPLKPESR